MEFCSSEKHTLTNSKYNQVYNNINLNLGVNMYHKQFSSIADEAGYELFIDTSNGDCFLEFKGQLIKTSTVDDQTDPVIMMLAAEFELED